MTQEHIPVFYEGQDDLVDILATSMASVCYNTKSFIDFYILDCGLCDFNKRQLESMKDKFKNFSIEFIPIDLNQFKDLKGYTAGNFVDCYSRILIPELKPKLDKAIYLDTDVIALDDIKQLWDIDLGKHVFAAVPDLGYGNLLQNNCIQNLGVSKTHVYPNAGVILFDLKKCRSMHFTDKMLDLAKKYKEHIIVIVEDLLSMLFNNSNYKRLDSRFNLSDRNNEIAKTCAPEITKEYLENEWEHVVIQHLSPGKAWKIATNNYNHRILKMFNAFWNFAKMTPFFEGMQNRYIWSSTEQIVHSYTERFSNPNCKNVLKLFNIIPVLTIRYKHNKTYYRLFDFIPLLKIKKK